MESRILKLLSPGNSVALSMPLILAPMSGVTNAAFRKLIKRENPGAVSLVVTEFISVEGITRDNQRSLEMMNFAEEERPLSIQIFGYVVDRMVRAAEVAEAAGADVVDINCGCPAPKVVKRGGGCELMRQPEHLGNILQSVRKRVQIPLTLKIRAGWDSDRRNAREIAMMAEDAGVEMLAIHGRTRTEMYRGSADWDIVQQVASERSIPVVGSGDVVDSESARARTRGNIAGLMIGRAALSNPWVFSEIASGSEPKQRSVQEISGVLRRYMALLEAEMPPRSVLGKMKQFASQVTRLVPASKVARTHLVTSSSVEDFADRLVQWEDYAVEAMYRKPQFTEAGAAA